MDYFQAENFFKNLFPDKEIFLEFDEKCIRQIECIMTDGLPHHKNHIEFNKLKATIEGMNPMYVDISPHRGILNWSALKNSINSKEDVWIHPDIFKNIEFVENSENPTDAELIFDNLELETGIKKDSIKEKYSKQKINR